MEYRRQCDHFCCDEWGDELYHDLLDVIASCQPPRPLLVMGERRDRFRPFVFELHNGAPQLSEFTVSSEKLRVMVRFCLYHRLGLASDDHPAHAGDLEETTDHIMRAFPQDPNIGINWPMFDEGCRATPHLFDALKYVVGLFWADPSPIDEDQLGITRTSTKLFTGAVIQQISTLFTPEALEWFDALLWSWYHDAAVNSVPALELVAAINNQQDPALILISGRDTDNQDPFILGLLIPCPAKDGKMIQPEWEDEPIPLCTLLELSPAQGMYPGSLECPAWTINGEDVIFGDPNHGVALTLKKELSRATFTQAVGGEDEPIFKPIEWRGNRHTELEIDAKEIAYCDYDEEESDEESHDEAALCEDRSDEDQLVLSPSHSGHD